MFAENFQQERDIQYLKAGLERYDVTCGSCGSTTSVLAAKQRNLRLRIICAGWGPFREFSGNCSEWH